MKPFLYALSTCYYCKRTKKWLDEHQVEFDFTDVDLATDEERQRLTKEIIEMTGASQFPVVRIRGKYVVGFNEERLKALLGVK